LGGANLCSQSFGIYCNFFLVYIPVLTLRNIAPIASADPPCNPQEPNDRNRTEGPNGVENVPQHSCGKRASFSNPRIEYMYYNDAIPQDTRSCKLTVIILLLCPGGKHPAPAQRSRGVTRPLSPGGGGNYLIMKNKPDPDPPLAGLAGGGPLGVGRGHGEGGEAPLPPFPKHLLCDSRRIPPTI